MSIPAKPTLTAPPTAPVRGEDKASFATKANAYVVFIGTNVTDLTAAIDWQNTVFTAVESEAADAAQSAVDAAAEVVLAADQVGLAADQVDLAEAQVVLAADEVALAEAAAAAAIVTANADAWVSGASYSVNANVISGIDFGTYRAILTHTGVATDPSADPTNWVKISSPEKASQAEAEAGTENTKFLTPLRAAEAIAALAAGIGNNVQTFTSSGTWTKPDNVTWVSIEVIGGGGGGNNALVSSGGGGGGGGGYNASIFLASNLDLTASITIGAGGAGGANGADNGGAAGGSSSFGPHLTAPGGGAGTFGISGVGGGGEAAVYSGQPNGGFSSGSGGINSTQGGSCVKGGGGGGGSNNGLGGVSVDGGNGGSGNSGDGVASVNGLAPGGGGGGSGADGGGGNGGAGKVVVKSW